VQSTPRTLGLLAAWAVLTAACSTYQQAARQQAGPARFTGSDALEPGVKRKNYVDAHYKQVLKSGRAANADQARAVAGLDWDSHERDRQTSPTQSYAWSSDDARKREQAQFESDLEKMTQK
jgi:hypothetical protein